MPVPDMLNVPKKRAHDALELQTEHLEGFRKSQQVAYACVSAIHGELQEGMTELQTTALMHVWMHDHGVHEFFHTAFAWFGDRSALPFKRDTEFAPTSRALTPGMPAILDIAPVVNGYSSDVGYACKLGENALHDQMLADLEPHRELILQGVRARRNLSQIYWEVDRLIQRQGYENRHRRYSNRVLGHRVNYVPPHERSQKLVLGFGTPGVKYLLSRVLQRLRGGDNYSPFWNDRPGSDHPPEPGLWAVEPHLGFRGVGVKWEELLVVTENDAFWLDDDLPHVRGWKQRRAATATAKSADHTLEARA
jgi:Xaa-Pro aminopeptidase